MTTAKPSILDRIFAYFRLQRYLRSFSQERAIRTSAMEELAAEKQPLIRAEREEYYDIPSASNKSDWTPEKRVVYTPPRDSRGRFVKIR